MNKVLLIGLDGATLDLIEPWIVGGKLPALKALIDNGAYGYLETVSPPVTPPAWVSMASGKNPGKHGIFDWITADGRLINSRSVTGKRVWNILSDAGYSCCVINVPVTYPPEKINGYMISCQLSPPGRNDYVYPASIMRTLQKNRYRTYSEGGWEFFAGRNIPRYWQRIFEMASRHRIDLLRETHDILESRSRTALELMNDRAWDFFFIVFSETDLVQHLLWDDRDAMLEFYTAVDRHIAELTRTFKSRCCRETDREVVLVASDHGFGSGATKLFNIQAWLAQQGEVSVAKVGLSRFMTHGMRVLFSRANSRSRPGQILRIAKMVYGQAGLSTGLSAGFYGIFIDRQRFRTEEAYEAKRSRLVEKLRRVTNPEDGKHVFKKVFKREELYHGENLHNLPDIIFAVDPDYAAFGYSDPRLWLENPFWLPGHHMGYPYGVLVVSGDDLRKHFDFGTAKIYDVAPTILHILGVAVPDDMDGRVLGDLFERGTELGERSVGIQKVPASQAGEQVSGLLSSEEEEQIKKRLKALGYLS